MSGPRAVTLDAAGTLIEVARPVGETYAAIAAEHGIPADVAAIGTAFRTVFPRMSPLAFGRTDAASLARQEREWWKTLVRGCLGRHGQHPAFARFFDALYGYYRSGDAWRLYPDVAGVLDELERRAIPVAVVSNFDSRLLDVLEALGVASRFVDVVYSSRAGAAKPDARIFHQACRALGHAPERTLHVGDDRRADLEGAAAAGLAALWLRRRGVDDADAPHIGDLHGLLARLD